MSVYGPATILVVDDEPIVLNFVRIALQRADFHVLTAESGAQALAICREHPGSIHLALLDVLIPGMNGPELRDCLNEEFPGIRILFMSGYSHEQMVEHGITAAPQDFVPKPFTPAGLVQRVRDALADSGYEKAAKSN